jgi:hypothetical protein
MIRRDSQEDTSAHAIVAMGNLFWSATANQFKTVRSGP